MAYLGIWLEAPLQSWGYDSRFGRRATLNFPTKSGVLGLFLCALGKGGAQAEWLSRWNKANMTVLAYNRSDTDGHLLEKAPLLEDFHMVGSAYDSSNPWENLFIPKMQDGKKSKGSGAKITHRSYLQDMAFAVIIQAERDSIEEVSQALVEPVWDLYLGRKTCAPTDLIYRGVFDTEHEAEDFFDTLAREKDRVIGFKVIEGKGEGEYFTLRDVPVQMGTEKKYSERIVTVIN